MLSDECTPAVVATHTVSDDTAYYVSTPQTTPYVSLVLRCIHLSPQDDVDGYSGLTAIVVFVVDHPTNHPQQHGE